MASEQARYILRNCTIFVDRENKVGQASEITIPVPQRTTTPIRNAGMMKTRNIELGYEALTLAFKMTAFDPQVIKLFASRTDREYMVTGAFVDEDGTIHSAVCTMLGKLTSTDAGAFKPGELQESDFSVDVNYLKLEMDGEVLLEMDDFEVISGGVSQTGGIRAALLM